jgi:hypothetical protein
MKHLIALFAIIGLLFAPVPAVAQFSYPPSLFRFVTIIPDDGQGPAGGYQEARADLRIVDTSPIIPLIYVCPVVVGMGLRTQAHGYISPDEAARVTCWGRQLCGERHVSQAGEVAR